MLGYECGYSSSRLITWKEIQASLRGSFRVTIKFNQESLFDCTDYLISDHLVQTEQETKKPQHSQRELPVGFLVSAAQNEKKKERNVPNLHKS